VFGAFFPDKLREILKDKMAQVGITEEDLIDLAPAFAIFAYQTDDGDTGHFFNKSSAAGFSNSTPHSPLSHGS
jgi:hypothetical protein